MDNLYEYIEKLVKENGYKNITEFCRAADIPRATMSELKAGRTKQLSAKTSKAIAGKLSIPVSVLLDAEPYDPTVHCSGCGFQYNSDNDEEVYQHLTRHNAWRKAVNKFGLCWNYSYREDEKADARAIVNDSTAPINNRVAAQIVVLKALFSRSLEATDYNLDHPSFDDYVAMILNQGESSHTIPSDVYRHLVAQYGKKPGISKGTYYVFPTPSKPDVLDEVDIAFYGEYKQLTEDDKDTIRDMVRVMRERRAKKQE